MPLLILKIVVPFPRKMESFHHDNVYMFQSLYRFAENGSMTVQYSVSLSAVSRPEQCQSSKAETFYGHMKPRFL